MRPDRRTRDSRRSAGFQRRGATVRFPRDTGQGTPRRQGDPLRKRDGHHRRHLGRVGEEDAEKTHRAELHGEAEAHVVPPAPADRRQIGVVEMEIAVELFLRRGPVEAAVTPLLLGRQKTDRHPIVTGPSRDRSSQRGQAYRRACSGQSRSSGRQPPCWPRHREPK